MPNERSISNQKITHTNSPLTRNNCRLFALLIYLITAPYIFSQEVYTPVETDPLLEKWRWTHFNEIVGKGMTCMTEAGNGVFAFGIRKGLIMYDGFEWKEHNKTNGFVDYEVKKLVFSSDQKLYAGTNQGLYERIGDKWSRIFPIAGMDESLQIIGSIQKLDDGGVVVSFGKGILIYKNGQYDIFTSSKIIDRIKTSTKVRTHLIPNEKCINNVFCAEKVLALF
jgi:hypothetical protein